MADILMNKFKLVIKEQNVNEAKFTFSTKGLALFVDDIGEEVELILYYIKPGFGVDHYEADVAGGGTIAKTGMPCIPETWQVETIFTAEKFQGQGIGSLLYGLMFYIANSRGYGLTSDHSVGTKKIAARKWKGFEKNPRFEKRATKDGNKKFDYFDLTPDREDDCDDGFDGPPSMATHHSLFDKNHKQFEPAFRKLQKAHDFYLNKVINKKEFTQSLEDESSNIFKAVYDKAK